MCQTVTISKKGETGHLSVTSPDSRQYYSLSRHAGNIFSNILRWQQPDELTLEAQCPIGCSGLEHWASNLEVLQPGMPSQPVFKKVLKSIR